jgi:hypothetical protein
MNLTWKDIKLICEIEDRYWCEEWEKQRDNSLEEYYTEVLHRFNEKKTTQVEQIKSEINRELEYYKNIYDGNNNKDFISGIIFGLANLYDFIDSIDNE